MLLIVLVVAAYLAGMRANRLKTLMAPPLAGAWTLHLPAGFQRPATITQTPEGAFVLGSGGVLSGEYAWRGGQLVVVQPSDVRMTGLVWSWDGSQLTLIAETPGAPTGSSYLGAQLKRPKATGNARGAPP
ncbi:MAG: hypothetical protein KDA42_10240 [Planctomycetales bacterium]|nr:hypothetical protein [Planctomycetales bacterium]